MKIDILQDSQYKILYEVQASLVTKSDLDTEEIKTFKCHTLDELANLVSNFEQTNKTDLNSYFKIIKIKKHILMGMSDKEVLVLNTKLQELRTININPKAIVKYSP